MPSSSPSRMLLVCGAAAGPLYIAVGLAQMLTREGFDMRRHALSLLSNGELGWIQIANFLVSGALVVAGGAWRAADAVRRSRRNLGADPSRHLWRRSHRRRRVFRRSGRRIPARHAARIGGHQPQRAPAFRLRWHRLLCTDCGVLRRRVPIRPAGTRGWAAYSAFTGIAFFVAFAAIASRHRIGGRDPLVLCGRSPGCGSGTPP